MSTHVGRYVRRCREKDGLSLRDVKKRVEFSDVFLSMVERGVRKLDESHWPSLAQAIPSLEVAELRTRADLDATMPIDLEDGADAGLALELARRMTTTKLTDEMTNSLIAILSGRK